MSGVSPDDSLARKAAQGDQRAFEEIFKRYHQDLYRFCLAMVGNPQDAQDALQNTMVKVLRALPGEKREIQLKPWLYRIARNESIEALRKRRDTSELESEQGGVEAVAERAETRERLRTVLADLKRLPERQRAALVMRELGGLEFSEIAASFGTSPAVARQTLYEARLSLHRLEAGREMRCADVKQELSDADGRVTRRREIRAHLQSCADCRAFGDAIADRRGELAAIAPLPVAASTGLLHGLLGGQAGSASGGAVGATGLMGSAGGAAGKAVATSAIAKTAATVAVAVVVGTTAADRGGLIDLPLPGKAATSKTEAARTGRGAAVGQDDVSGTAGAVSIGRGSGKSRSTPNASGEDHSANRGSEGHTHSSHSGEPGDGGGEGSRSQAGAAPPGGGHGRSASESHGRPEQLPEASSKGQQTADAHKANGNPSPPGQSASGGAGEKPAHEGSPAAAEHGRSAHTEAPGETPPPAEAHSGVDGDHEKPQPSVDHP
jgi:RNA polymerase sigma factor (sigma-70 family)